MRVSRLGIRATSLLALTVALEAQTTWVVDIDNRPGTHFTSLQPAVQAAAPGDTILVRLTAPGSVNSPVFGMPATTSKGVRIVGETGPSNARPILNRATITNLPAGQTFELVNFVVDRGATVLIGVFDCRGRVHIENYERFEGGGGPQSNPAVEVRRSDAVTLNHVALWGGSTNPFFGGTPVAAVEVEQSFVSITDSWLGAVPSGLGSGLAVDATNAVVEIVEPRFDATLGRVPNAVIQARQSRITIAGSANSFLRGDPAVAGVAGEVIYDPSLLSTYQGGPTVTGTINGIQRATAHTSAFDAAPGSPLRLVTRVPQAATAATFVGLSQVPAANPLATSSQLIDPRGAVLLNTTLLPSAGEVTLQIPLPASAPRGISLTAQAVVLPAAGAPSLGLGTVFAVR